MKNFFFRF